MTFAANILCSLFSLSPAFSLSQCIAFLNYLYSAASSSDRTVALKESRKRESNRGVGTTICDIQAILLLFSDSILSIYEFPCALVVVNKLNAFSLLWFELGSSANLVTHACRLLPKICATKYIFVILITCNVVSILTVRLRCILLALEWELIKSFDIL